MGCSLQQSSLSFFSSAETQRRGPYTKRKGGQAGYKAVALWEGIGGTWLKSYWHLWVLSAIMRPASILPTLHTSLQWHWFCCKIFACFQLVQPRQTHRLFVISSLCNGCIRCSLMHCLVGQKIPGLTRVNDWGLGINWHPPSSYDLRWILYFLSEEVYFPPDWLDELCSQRSESSDGRGSSYQKMKANIINCTTSKHAACSCWLRLSFPCREAVDNDLISIQ